MHDPSTVAFEIKSPFKGRGDRWFPNGYRKTLITIWHCDPETDGTDDSCGWFPRARHGDKVVLEKIQKEFDFNLKNNYWFNRNKEQIFSTIGTLIQMYNHATWIYFNQNRSRQNKFMKKHLYSIISLAENPHDCIGDAITNKWGYENDKVRFDELAGIIYADIIRKERKWYQHPKWHIWHWEIQFNFMRDIFKKKEKADSETIVAPNPPIINDPR